MTEQQHTGPVLVDRWAHGGKLPLNGLLERQRFSPLWTALLTLAGSWVLFQVVGAVVMVALLSAQQVPLDRLAADYASILVTYAQELLLANSLGQLLGLALPAFALAALHSTRVRAFLRLRRTTLALLGWSLLGLVTLWPVVQWLSTLNQWIPLPEWLRAFEASQMSLIKEVLESGGGPVFSLLVLAVVPAFCEEMLFRGYAQRQLERRLGAVGAIFLTGVLFGAYHLRFSQLLPLTVLGFYLAYIVWRTGSLWPAVLVHFANNAFSIVLAELSAAQAELRPAEVETMQLPWYIVFAGAVGFGVSVWALRRTALATLERRRARNATGVIRKK